jgi:hypothetical protein
MRYLGGSVATLVAAMNFSLAPLGRIANWRGPPVKLGDLYETMFEGQIHKK